VSSLCRLRGILLLPRAIPVCVTLCVLAAAVAVGPVASAASPAARGEVPPILPVLSATELGPITQNAVIKGRDGAQSGLFDGTSIWTFGDTILTVPGHDGDSWANDTLSTTTDLTGSDGIVLPNDVVDKTGAPTEFLPLTRQEARFNRLHDPENCHQPPCGAEYALWAGPVVPDPERNRVLHFYLKISRVIGQPGWITMGTGIAVWTPGGKVVRPIESPGSPDPTLMFLQDEVGFSSGSYVEGDTLFSYGCYPGFLVQHCQLARAPLTDALERSTWTFYAGGGVWSHNIADAVTVFDGGAANEVFFDPFLGDYVSIYSQPLSSDVMYRVSYAPWGPWSDQALLFHGIPGQSFDYAALSHPEYAEGSGQTQYVTYVRPTGLFVIEVRLVQVVFGLP
jgi:Domain of unknown function (DUF4185)